LTSSDHAIESNGEKRRPPPKGVALGDVPQNEKLRTDKKGNHQALNDLLGKIAHSSNRFGNGEYLSARYSVFAEEKAGFFGAN